MHYSSGVSLCQECGWHSASRFGIL